MPNRHILTYRKSGRSRAYFEAFNSCFIWTWVLSSEMTFLAFELIYFKGSKEIHLSRYDPVNTYNFTLLREVKREYLSTQTWKISFTFTVLAGANSISNPLKGTNWCQSLLGSYFLCLSFFLHIFYKGNSKLFFFAIPKNREIGELAEFLKRNLSWDWIETRDLIFFVCFQTHNHY